MELIIGIIGIIVGIGVAIAIYVIMRQQVSIISKQLDITEKELSSEQEKLKASEIALVSIKTELEYERKSNAESRKLADEKLNEQIKYLQTELTNTTQKLLDIRSEKLEQTNKTQMSSIIDPLKETISKLEKEMKETQMQHGDTTTRLEQSIKNLVKAGYCCGG
jgi:DNA anti-recombination protein RmuC